MPLAAASTTLDIGPFQGHVAWEMRLCFFFSFSPKVSRICISYLAATVCKTELWCSFLSVGSYFEDKTSNFNMNHKSPTIAVTSGLLRLSLPGTVPGELPLLLCSIGLSFQKYGHAFYGCYLFQEIFNWLCISWQKSEKLSNFCRCTVFSVLFSILI